LGAVFDSLYNTLENYKSGNLVVVVALFGQPDFRFASSEILMDLVVCIDPVGEDFQLG